MGFSKSQGFTNKIPFFRPLWSSSGGVKPRVPQATWTVRNMAEDTDRKKKPIQTGGLGGGGGLNV